MVSVVIIIAPYVAVKVLLFLEEKKKQKDLFTWVPMV